MICTLRTKHSLSNNDVSDVQRGAKCCVCGHVFTLDSLCNLAYLVFHVCLFRVLRAFWSITGPIS